MKEKLPHTYCGTKKLHHAVRQITFLAILILALHRVYNIFYNPRQGLLIRTSSYPPERGYMLLYQDSWISLANALERGRPKLKASLSVTSKFPGKSIEHLDEEDEFDDVSTDHRTLAILKVHHNRFVEALTEDQIRLAYYNSRRGIVITGSMSNYPAILVQMRLLRRTGSSLPVEIFLVDEDDYNDEICKRILPRLNARCRILEHLIRGASLPFVHNRRSRRVIKPNEPLHKLLAIFFSTFEENLLLGPDTLVYNNPDSSFKQEPFLSKGLVLWPDFWASSISPKMSLIQKKQTPNTVDKSRTVDLGQMMLSKSIHRDSLLLAIYYTYYGPGLYDVLLRQSDGGEAGSQAIKAAARYLDTNFYIVKKFVEAVGYPDLDKKKHDFRGVAMLQYFPLEDYHRQPSNEHIPAFVRANNPAIDPLKILDAGVTSFASKGGEPHRMWEWFGGRYKSNGWRNPDPEKALWAELVKVACNDLTNVRLYTEDAQQSCLRARIHQSRADLMETENVP